MVCILGDACRAAIAVSIYQYLVAKNQDGIVLTVSYSYYRRHVNFKVAAMRASMKVV